MQPFASLIGQVPRGTPRLLINRERVGEGALAIPGPSGPFCFDAAVAGSLEVDQLFLGDCNDAVHRLAQAAGWEDELVTLCSQGTPGRATTTHKARTFTPAPPASPPQPPPSPPLGRCGGQPSMSLTTKGALQVREGRGEPSKAWFAVSGEMSQGEILLGRRRTRAALRRYEHALQLAERADAEAADEAWEALANAALCAILLAEAHHSGRCEVAWRSALGMPSLIMAQQRLLCALTRAPNHPILLRLERRLRVVALATHTTHPPHGLGMASGELQAVLRAAAAAHCHQAGSAIVRSWQHEDVKNAAGETLMIAFAGADAVGRRDQSIPDGVPSHEFVSSCRRAGVRYAVFVRDALRSWYLRGLGEDYLRQDDDELGYNFAGMVRQLQVEIEALRPSRVVTIGSSMGGYAAIRAALELDADAALAFAPQVRLDLEARRACDLPESPFDSLLEGLAAYARTEPHMDLCSESLDAVIERLPPRVRTRLDVHVGDLDAGDVNDAERLQEVIEQRQLQMMSRGNRGVLSCSVHVHKGRGHNLVVDMRNSGELHELLQALIAPPGGRTVRRAQKSGIPQTFIGFKDCPDF